MCRDARTERGMPSTVDRADDRHRHHPNPLPRTPMSLILTTTSCTARASLFRYPPNGATSMTDLSRPAVDASTPSSPGGHPGAGGSSMTGCPVGGQLLWGGHGDAGDEAAYRVGVA